MREKIEELLRRTEEALHGGGEERIKKQKEKGRMYVRERIDALLDKGSFTELFMLAEHQCTQFGMEKKKIPGDGVIVGHGLIEGRRVFIYANDATVFGGSIGAAGGSKMAKAISMARRMGAPLIGLVESAGARIQEGMDNLRGYSTIFYEHVISSGVVPQISAIMGICSGGAAYSPGLSDFILQVNQTSHMFITGPGPIKQVTGEEVSFEQLGGGRIHAERSGVSHFLCNDENDCIKTIKDLLRFMPSNSREKPPVIDWGDDPKRTVPALEKIVPTDPRKIYDVKDVIHEIVDKGYFLEVQSRFAKNMVIGFARLNGHSVGIVANQPRFLAGAIDIDASDKSARFVRFCDAFNIPILTFVDNPGYMPGKNQEYGGIIRHGAKMLYAYSEATVPKVSLVLRKDYGGGISAMGVKEMGTDQIFVLPTAEMAIIGAEAAVDVLYRKEISSAEDPEAQRKIKLDEYKRAFCTPYHSASKQVVDGVIEPSAARAVICEAFSMLQDKHVEDRPWSKHGNIPL